MSILDKTTLGNLLGEPLKEIKVTSGSKKSDGVAGSLKSVKTTTESGKVNQIMCKLHPSDTSMLAYLINCRVMEVENEFYNFILPTLRQILNSHGHQKVDLPFPQYYGGSDLFILLDDLRPKNFKMADKFKGLSFQETNLVMEKLAFYHALSYFLIRQEGEKFFEMNDVMKLYIRFTWYPTEMPVESRSKITPIFESVVRILKKLNEKLADKLVPLVPKFLQLFPGIYDKTDVKYFPVICLGDLWVNNCLFRYGKQGEVEDVKFIDLQQAHRGNIFEDLLYFFVTSTTPIFRKHHLTTVLQTYHNSFAKTLKSLKCPMPRGFTLGFLIDNYFENMLNISVFVGGAIAFQLGGEEMEDDNPKNEDKEEEDGSEENSIVLVRHKPEDLVSLEEHFSGIGDFVDIMLNSSSRAKQRFEEVIQEFDDLGVFS